MSVSETELRTMIKQLLAEQATKNQAPKESSVEHVEHCPDCFAKAVRARAKNTDYVCDHCGLPLGNEELVKKLSDCPNCGGTKPRKLDSNEKMMRMSKP